MYRAAGAALERQVEPARSNNPLRRFEHPWRVTGAAAAWALTVVVLDSVGGLGAMVGNLQVLTVLILSLGRNRTVLATGAVAAAALGWVGVLSSVAAGEDTTIGAYVLAERLLSTLVVLVVAALCDRQLARSEQLLRAVEDLESARRESQEQRRLDGVATDVARVGGWHYDVAADRLDWSDEVAAIHGLPAGYRPSRGEGLEYYSEPDRPRIFEATETCARTGAGFSLEAWLEPVDGSPRRRVVITGRAVRRPGEPVAALQGALQDITAAWTAERRAEASDRRLRELADSLPLVVWTAEPDGTVDFFGRPFLDYVGAGAAASLPLWSHVVHPDDEPIVSAAWADAMDDGQPFATQVRLRRHDGEWRWHLVQARLTHDEAGVPQKWLGSFTDINDVLSLQEKAAAMSQHLEATLSSVAGALFVLDAHGAFVLVNPAAEQLLGLPAERLVGQRLSSALPNLADSTLATEVAKAMTTDQSAAFDFHHQRSETVLEVRAYPMAGAGAAVYLRDVTTERDLRRQLVRAQKLESLGQMTGGIAHDFNNLLTVISGHAELMAGHLVGGSPEHQDACTILAAADRGAALTSRLLVFARRQPLDPQPVDVAVLLEESASLLTRTLGGQVEIRLGTGSGVCAQADPAQLESALMNLALNARDAMPDGGRLTLESQVTTHLGRDGGRASELAEGSYACIVVSDTGTGMEQAQLDRAFEPFFSTKDPARNSGLGLAVVYGFAKQSGGTVSIHSEVGVGTTVRLYLPLADASGVSPVDEIPEIAQPGDETVLLVEDEATVRSFVAGVLTDLGYRVVTAEDAAAAMEILSSRSDVDLLFTDLVMPGGISGTELASQVQGADPGIKVLLTSGYTEAATRRQALAQRWPLLSKPYRTRTLAAYMRRALDA